MEVEIGVAERRDFEHTPRSHQEVERRGFRAWCLGSRGLELRVQGLVPLQVGV